MEKEGVRIGVFVCECGLNIGGILDCDALAEYATTLPGVVFSVKNTYTCSDPGQQEVKQAIVEQRLNRVVIASCTPRMHEPTFRRCVADVGLNPYLMEMANIREQCSWVHADEREAATNKAKEVIRASVARAGRLEPQIEAEVPVTPVALVVGGGVAGMQAALDIADAGYRVHLVEREPTIGGVAAQLNKIYPSMD